jgi:putative DNA primase/helicase
MMKLANIAPESDRSWDDENFQDQLVRLLLRDKEALEKCTAANLSPEDFSQLRGLRGMKNGRSRSIVSARALEHYNNKKYREPLGDLARADVLEYAERLNLGAQQIGDLKQYLIYLDKLKPVAPASLVDKVLLYRSRRNDAAVIGELTELQQSGMLTDEKKRELAQRLVAVTTVGWPEPEPLASELPPVEAFSLDLLPASFRDLVADVAERMQVPMDYPAVLAVLCLAGAVNRRAVIQPKANDTGWVVVPNLWGGIIAPPGFMKSPVLQAATRPLNQIQTEWRQEHEEALKGFGREKEEYELRRAAWKEQYKSSTKKGKSAPDRPEDEPGEPKLRRLIINDATFEALHQTMSDNPAGILVIRDELTGWWSQLDRAGREGERAFCLQAWNGDTGHTIDRIERGTIHVEACCMSMMGGIQPGRLRSYLVDTLAGGPSDDGMIQRFQLLVWPDTAPDWRYVDRLAAEDGVAAIFRRLVAMDAKTPTRFRFEPRAQKFFVSWLADLEATVRSGDLHPALTSHLAKYRSLMPTLAVLFELADRVVEKKQISARGGVEPYRWVRLEHAQRAVAWCRYLESHARRIYSCIVTPQFRASRELADKLQQRKIGSPFASHEVYLKGWAGLDTPDTAKRAVEVLQDLGWVRRISDEQRSPQGGRPATRYEINPRIYAEPSGGVI